MKQPSDCPTTTRCRRLADCFEHRLRVLGKSGGIVVARKIRRDRVVTPGAQLGLDEVPIPADVTGAVNQNVRRHEHPCVALMTRYEKRGERRGILDYEHVFVYGIS